MRKFSKKKKKKKKRVKYERAAGGRAGRSGAGRRQGAKCVRGQRECGAVAELQFCQVKSVGSGVE